MKKLYSFDDLTDKAAEKAVDEVRDIIYNSETHVERYDMWISMKKFLDAVGYNLSIYDYKLERGDVSFDIRNLHKLSDIAGSRLLRWWNRFEDKYLITEKRYLKYNFKGSLHSKVFKDRYSEPFTGSEYDRYILMPIYDFWKDYRDYWSKKSLKDLVDECIKNAEKEFDEMLEYLYSDDNIYARMDAYNEDFLFYKDGTLAKQL